MGRVCAFYIFYNSGAAVASPEKWESRDSKVLLPVCTWRSVSVITAILRPAVLKHGRCRPSSGIFAVSGRSRFRSSKFKVNKKGENRFRFACEFVASVFSRTIELCRGLRALPHFGAVIETRQISPLQIRRWRRPPESHLGKIVSWFRVAGTRPLKRWKWHQLPLSCIVNSNFRR